MKLKQGMPSLIWKHQNGYFSTKRAVISKKEFVIETTLSGNTEKRLIDEAIKIGYLVRIYFLTVLNSQDCIDRVKKGLLKVDMMSEMKTKSEGLIVLIRTS